MKTYTFHSAADRLHARLMGTCFIQVGADGQVSGTEGSLSVTGGGDVQKDGGILVTGPKDIVADPAAPKTEETPAADPANPEETPEEKAARETAEAAQTDWEKRDKTKDVALSDEQKARLEAMKDLNNEQRASVTEFTIETNTTGDLSEASRDKAAKLWGVPRAMVDNYVDGIKAANARAAAAPATEAPAREDVQQELTPAQKQAYGLRMDALYTEAGSKDTWEQFAAWATGGGLTEAEQVELAGAIDVSPNMGVMAAKQYISKWKEQGGSAGPTDVTRNAGQSRTDNQNPAVKAFANRSEEQAAINKTDASGRTLMDSDAQYRAAVEARMAISNYSQVEESFFKGGSGMMGTL